LILPIVLYGYETRTKIKGIYEQSTNKNCLNLEKVAEPNGSFLVA